MQPVHLTKPPTDKEIDQISNMLEKVGAHMNLEAIDGFFAALHCSPDLVMPSQYLGDILGDQSDDANAFDGEEEAQTFFSLLMQHWNHVGSQLREDEMFLPLLLEEDGTAYGNDWAQGFLQGIEHNRDEWQVLLDDEDHAGSMIPIFVLAHEHSSDPELRPYSEPISDERREELIVAMAAGTMRIYRYFENHREFSAHERSHAGTYRRETEKVGRNDPCPCGSGKKYKKCCGNPTLH